MSKEDSYSLADVIALLAAQDKNIQALVARQELLEQKLDPTFKSTPSTATNNGHNVDSSTTTNSPNATTSSMDNSGDSSPHSPKGKSTASSAPTTTQQAPVPGGTGQTNAAQATSSSSSSKNVAFKAPAPKPHITDPFGDNDSDGEIEDSLPTLFPQDEGTLSPFDPNLPGLYEALSRRVHNFRLDRDCIWKKATGFKGESRKEIAALKKIFACLEVTLKTLELHDIEGHGTSDLFIDVRASVLAGMYAILSRRKYLFVLSNANEETAKTFDAVRGHSSELSREEQADLLFAAKLGRESQKLKDAERRKNRGNSGNPNPSSNNNNSNRFGRDRRPFGRNQQDGNVFDRSIRNNSGNPRPARPQDTQGGGPN